MSESISMSSIQTNTSWDFSGFARPPIDRTDDTSYRYVFRWMIVTRNNYPMAKSYTGELIEMDLSRNVNEKCDKNETKWTRISRDFTREITRSRIGSQHKMSNEIARIYS